MVKNNEEAKVTEQVLQVVAQLPTTPFREFTQDEKNYKLITIEEALAEIVLTLRELKKGLL